MKSPIISPIISILAILVSFQAMAQHHHNGSARKAGHHFHHHQPSDSVHAHHAARAVDDLYDYVTNLSPDKKDDLTKAFNQYFDDAKSHSPTSKVRKRSQDSLDSSIRPLLSEAQYNEYQTFVKDMEKRRHNRKHWHGKHKRHC